MKRAAESAKAGMIRPSGGGAIGSDLVSLLCSITVGLLDGAADSGVVEDAGLEDAVQGRREWEERSQSSCEPSSVGDGSAIQSQSSSGAAAAGVTLSSVETLLWLV